MLKRFDNIKNYVEYMKMYKYVIFNFNQITLFLSYTLLCKRFTTKPTN